MYRSHYRHHKKILLTLFQKVVVHNGYWLWTEISDTEIKMCDLNQRQYGKSRCLTARQLFLLFSFLYSFLLIQVIILIYCYFKVPTVALHGGSQLPQLAWRFQSPKPIFTYPGQYRMPVNLDPWQFWFQTKQW